MAYNIGDKGTEISEAQKLLSLIGYDLVIDGHYGKTTARSVKAFQKRVGLVTDGILGNRTLQALRAAQKRTSKEDKATQGEKNYGDLEVVTDCRLSSEQYIKQAHPKNQIYIHFTAGGPSARNVIQYWDGNQPRIATAYVIGRDDGKVYEAFSPDHWSYHLGIKSTKGKLDKASIGIEICAYGPLKKQGDKYYAWPGDYTKELPEKNVFKLSKTFRGFDYFESYTSEQMKNLEKLLEFLVGEYDIKVQDSFDDSWFEYNQDVIDKRLPGIWTHVTVRDDKTDTFPDQSMLDMLNRIAKKANGC